MERVKKRTISGVFKKYTIILVSVTVFFVAVYVVYSSVSYYQKEVSKDYTNGLQQSYRRSFFEVDKIYKYVNNSKRFFERDLRAKLESEISQVTVVVDGFVNKFRSTMPEKQLKNVVKETIRQISDNTDDNYLFITDLKGNSILYPPSPESEGKNLYELLSETTNLNKEIQLVKSYGEGFVIGFWDDPDDDSDKAKRKLTYVRSLKFDDWFVGTGMYFEDFVERQKIKIIENIEDSWLNYDNDFILLDEDDVVLLVNSMRYSEGQSLSGNFLDNDNDDLAMLGDNIRVDVYGDYWIVKRIENWDWSVYIRLELDPINAMIVSSRNDFRTNLMFKLIGVVVILLIVWIVNILYLRKLAARINVNFNSYISDLESAIDSLKPITFGSYSYREFALIAKTTNEFVNKRRDDEEKLRLNEERFRMLYENVPVMIFSFDENRRISLWNKKLQKSLGVVVVGDEADSDFNIPDFVPDKKQKYILLKQLLSPDGVFREFGIVNRIGKSLNHTWSFFRSGDLVFGVGHDITELKDKESQLLKSQNELVKAISTRDRFFSIIAHDLKSPFNALIGFASLLELRFAQLDDEKRLLYITKISESSRRMFKLLDNLLMWARAQSGELVLESDYVSIGQVLRDNLAVLNQAIANKKIDVKIVGNNEVVGYFDRNQISTAVRNILSNAIKYSHNKGIIEINVMEMVDFITVRIKDYGIGLDPNSLKYLFTLEHTMVTPESNAEKGTGLGLLLTKEFIEINGGKIWAENNPDAGTVFVFTLPRKKKGDKILRT
ncbi:MAG: cache domain-containing protein [Bacteroidales bacterium]|jgi:PAS domain S-box-containing protein|nr:cache domain-containing protein [Bacteroidales bacterium]